VAVKASNFFGVLWLVFSGTYTLKSIAHSLY
jgi:hypothetical protein